MEKNEKNEKPAWVVSVETEFSPLVHGLVGNLALGCIESFGHVLGLSCGLATNVLAECSRLLNEEIAKTCNTDD